MSPLLTSTFAGATNSQPIHPLYPIYLPSIPAPRNGTGLPRHSTQRSPGGSHGRLQVYPGARVETPHIRYSSFPPSFHYGELTLVLVCIIF